MKYILFLLQLAKQAGVDIQLSHISILYSHKALHILET